MKTITTVTTKICKRINHAKPSEETLYDGGGGRLQKLSKLVSRHHQYATTMRFIGLEDVVKGVEEDPYDIEDWDEYFTQDDREFIYDVITNTVTQVQLYIIESSDRNAILLLVHYFRKAMSVHVGGIPAVAACR
ncbi:hypothetical protein PPROV_000330900 [Pycnococcus provasolii]|uniref:Uncharacterized protein n=1 Tax=Pycnococcus provasolii TaxID=41880 RepID=A0A830HC14_9CHLO|nr:hypothetical protein PPROV_000330900 [Pycnococcus provasolii]